MTAKIEVPEALIIRYHQLVADRPNIAKLGISLAIFLPRFDAYLSTICAKDDLDPNRVDMAEYFSSGLLGTARWMQKYKYWGHYGHTINPINYLLEFPAKQVSVLWIPKNSCTSLKNLLLQFEPEEIRARIRKNRFHETVQKEFAIPMPRFMKDEFSPSICLVRNPYERLVSCYIDKFAAPVIKGKHLEPFVHGHIWKAQHLCGDPERGIERSISFSEFVRYISGCFPWELDQHWRPQADFLCGFPARGATLVRSDNFDHASDLLGIKRAHERHNVSGGKKFDPDQPVTGLFSDILPEDMDLAKMYSYNDFMSEELFDLAKQLYDADSTLYEAAI